MRLAMAALVAGTGCAQLFGLDDTTGVDAPIVDVASVQVQRVSVGASVIKGPQDLSSQTAQFLTDDGTGGFTVVAGDLAPPDTFTAAVTGTPSVVISVPDKNAPKRLWALPARMQKGSLIAFEHPNAQPPLPTSMLNLSVTLPSAYVSTPVAESFVVQSIGAWMQHTLTSPAQTGAPDTGLTTIATTLNYSTFTSMTGGDKYRITSADVTLLLRYTGALLSGVFQSQFDQTDGADGMTGTMTAVTADKMAMAMLDPPTFVTRFAAVRPAVAGNAMGWRIFAAPGWQYAAETGVRLNSAVIGATDMTITAPFGNPFESLDWRSLFTVVASSARSYMYTEGANMLAVSLSAAMSMTVEPGTAMVNVTMPAGLPITVTANQTALVTDGMPLTVVPTKAVEIVATLDRPTNTLYEVHLIELGIDTTGTAPALTRKVVLSATSTLKDFKLPPEYFVVGKSYYLSYRTTQGLFPDAASGDLQTTMLPRSAAALDTAVFTVVMP